MKYLIQQLTATPSGLAITVTDPDGQCPRTLFATRQTATWWRQLAKRQARQVGSPSARCKA